MKLLIITADPKTLSWKSLPTKITAITGALNSGKGAGFSVEAKYVDVTPYVVDGKINHDWFKSFQTPYFSQGYDFVGLHGSLTQKRKWGVKDTLRGANPRMDGEEEQFYFFANETTKRNGFNQFIETCLHETKHGYHWQTKTLDTTHVDHERDVTIVPSMQKLDWTLYQPVRMILRKTVYLLQLLVKRLTSDSVASQATLHPRLPKEFNELISQDYGVKNSIYKITGRHIGIDYACPKNTPIYAPYNGEIIVTGEHASLGKFCYFSYVFEGKKRVERSLHLSEIPEQGYYKRGDIIAYSGNTGFSTGYHYHVDGFWDEVKIGSINKNNWSELTYNPHIKYESK